MRLSDKLQCLAAWLAHEDNELLADADGNDEALRAVATALTIASDALNETAEYVAAREPEEAQFSAEKLEEIAATAAALDAEGLCKEAAVLDDILLTIGAPKGFGFSFKKAEEDRISELKKKYQDNAKKVNETQNKVGDDLKTLKDSGVIDRPKHRDTTLSSRYCTSHPGVSLQRTGENQYRCPMDGAEINFELGYQTLSGTKIPPTSVANQSRVMEQGTNDVHTIFDTRSSRLGMNS
jgi:hypothetical protein